jgi:hypothetical protein
MTRVATLEQLSNKNPEVGGTLRGVRGEHHFAGGRGDGECAPGSGLSLSTT